jgi:hypothetical protein
VVVADNTATPPTETTVAAKDKHVSSSIFCRLIGAPACAPTVTPIVRNWPGGMRKMTHGRRARAKAHPRRNPLSETGLHSRVDRIR